MTSTGSARHERVCAFDGVTIRVDYSSGRVTAATGMTARAWAQTPDVIEGTRWGLSFGTEEADVEPARATRPDFHNGIAAMAALVVTLVIRALGPRERSISRLMGVAAVTPRRRSRPATRGEAERAVAAVRWAAAWMPFRIACLEESIAAVLVLAARRRQAVWCHGVAPDPVQFHAWIQVHGSPVAEPPTTSRYTVLCTIP